ncbi:MAG: XdhC family protein [Burkholderiaceae bacterium]
MDNVDLQVLKKADEWLSAGHRAVLGTVIHTWGSAPRPVGALVAVRDDGLIVGSVSGGCIEDDLVDRIRSKALAAHRPERVKYGVTAEEAFRFGLPCGGTIELVLEPLSAASKIGPLLERVIAGRHTRRTLHMASGDVALEDSNGADVLDCSDDALVSVHGPRWRLLAIGAGQLTHYVAQMALACDYQVTICDPRSEYADSWFVPGTELVRTMPDDTVLQINPDRHTAIVALTHDPKLDDMALIEALQSSAFYVGAIGSQRTQAARRERLKEFGVSDEQIARLHGPVGLKNGARTPPEIAASIITEMTAVKYGFEISTP